MQALSTTEYNALRTTKNLFTNIDLQFNGIDHAISKTETSKIQNSCSELWKGNISSFPLKHRCKFELLEYKIKQYLNILVRNTIIQIRYVELGPRFYGRRSTTLSCVRCRRLIREHIMLPCRLRCLNAAKNSKTV